MIRTLLLASFISVIPTGDGPAPPPLLTLNRFIRVTWEPGPGWPTDLLAKYPEIDFQCLVNSRDHSPSVNVVEFPYETYITNGQATGVTSEPIGVKLNWGAIVMAGSKQFACYESNRLYKVSWTGMQITVPGDEDLANLSTVMTVQYIGTPPIF